MLSEVVIPLGRPNTCQCDCACDGGAAHLARAIPEARQAGARHFVLAIPARMRAERAVAAAQAALVGPDETLRLVEGNPDDWDRMVAEAVQSCERRAVLLLDPMLMLYTGPGDAGNGLWHLTQVPRHRWQTVLGVARASWEAALDMPVLDATGPKSATRICPERDASSRDGTLPVFAGRAILNRKSAMEWLAEDGHSKEDHFPFESLLEGVTTRGTRSLICHLEGRLAKETRHPPRPAPLMLDQPMKLAS